MIAVTGAAGLLGSNLVLTLLAQGERVLSLCRNWRFHPRGAELLTLDLCHQGQVRQAFDAVPIRVLVHCAAASDVDWCERNPQEAERQNVTVTRLVAEAARDAGANMIYISTDSVYDGSHGMHSETEAPSPCNRYAETKLRGEQVAQDVLGPDALVLRTTLHGWNAQPKQSLSEWVIAKLSRGEVVPGFTDVIFCPLLANDLAAIIADLLRTGTTGIVNVAGSEAVSKYDFAVRLAEVFGYDAGRVQPTKIEDGALPAARAKNMSLDTSRLSAILRRRPPDVLSGLLAMKHLRETGYVEGLKSSIQGNRNAYA